MDFNKDLNEPINPNPPGGVHSEEMKSPDWVLFRLKFFLGTITLVPLTILITLIIFISLIIRITLISLIYRHI